MEKTFKREPSKFRVTVKARMYHGILSETMTRLRMDRRQFAKYLGIGYTYLCGLLWMKIVPKFKTKRGKEIKQSLEDATGVSIAELFPDHIFTDEFLGQDKTIDVTRDVPSHLLANAGIIHQLSLPPDETMMRKEEEGENLAEMLEPVLQTLTKRQRMVIQLRFFEGKTLEQCMPSLNAKSRQSVKQLEAEALRRLHEPMRMRMLNDFDRNGHIQSPQEARFSIWLTQSITSHFPTFEKTPR